LTKSPLLAQSVDIGMSASAPLSEDKRTGAASFSTDAIVTLFVGHIRQNSFNQIAG